MFIKSDREVDHFWTLHSVHKFIRTLMKLTECSDVHELKNHVFKSCIWNIMAERFKMKVKNIKYFWYQRLHLQLFCPKPIYVSDIKIKLIEYLYERGITSNKEINWTTILKYFDGYTSQYLSQTLSNLLRIARTKTSYTKLIDQIEFLYNEYLPHLINDSDDFKLPRLLYTQKRLVHVDVDEIYSTDTSEDE